MFLCIICFIYFFCTTTLIVRHIRWKKETDNRITKLQRDYDHLRNLYFLEQETIKEFRTNINYLQILIKEHIFER